MSGNVTYVLFMYLSFAEKAGLFELYSMCFIHAGQEGKLRVETRAQEWLSLVCTTLCSPAC